MIDISKINKPQESKPTKSAVKSGSTNFADFLNNTTEVESNNINTASGISLANAIFAQVVNTDEEERKKQALKRGTNLIEKLEEIRDSILLNDFSKEKLLEISKYVKTISETTQDEELNELIAQIELRVEVELAKLDTLFF